MNASKKDNEYENKILGAWEEIYRRGQLTFWILLSLKESPKYSAELLEWLEIQTKGTLVPEERSLYRSLQRFHDTELIQFNSEPSEKGPDRKRYELTPLGLRVLHRFIERNISLFSSPSVKSVIDK